MASLEDELYQAQIERHKFRELMAWMYYYRKDNAWRRLEALHALGAPVTEEELEAKAGVAWAALLRCAQLDRHGRNLALTHNPEMRLPIPGEIDEEDDRPIPQRFRQCRVGLKIPIS